MTILGLITMYNPFCHKHIALVLNNPLVLFLAECRRFSETKAVPSVYTLESGVRKKLRCHVTISWRTFALLLFVLYAIRPFQMVHLQTCCITQTSSLSNTLWYHLTIVWHLHHSLLLSTNQQRVFIAKAHTLFNFHIAVFYATWIWKAPTSTVK